MNQDSLEPFQTTILWLKFVYRCITYAKVNSKLNYKMQCVINLFLMFH